MIKKKNFSEIANFYDFFFFDLYGVTHNGIKLFPGIVPILKQIKVLKKKAIFISNAPRRSEKIKSFLNKIGLKRSLYLDVFSSGDITYKNYLTKLKKKKKYYFIGAKKDNDFCNGLKIIKEKELEKSDFILNLGVNDGERLAEYKKILNEAAKLSLLMVCVNPDLEVIRGKKKEICAGSLALEYKKFGGNILYFGKPHLTIYKEISKKLKIKSKKKILAIGDSLRTDILGANNYNIDSALVLSGIHSKIKEIEKICKKTNIYPKFLFNELMW
ncbi:MAG: hypothetical protein CFH26_00238 [Alphaproteobacteria bacterium MarineAlpha6_Bin4]|nr:MAG: hypothetical protein CFH26_00238 [Alphaproteobacteria bacterium MarineAlpha6_Bin4]|tara:strand:- start:13530 stop:14345 length:816 start_codon:yes stop_codon:yes gene_type:complete